MGKGTCQVMEVQHKLIRNFFSIVELLKLGTLYPGGFGFTINYLGYGGISFVESDQEEPFSSLTIAMTLERVRRLIGSRAASVESLVVTGSPIFMGVTFCVSKPLFDATVTGVGAASLGV